MRTWVVTAGLILAAASSPAQESTSRHYSNRSLGSGHAIAPPPQTVSGPARLPAARPEAPASARPALNLPLPPAPAPRPWHWPAVAIGFGALLAAVVLRRRAALRRRGDEESLALAAHELKSPLAAIESYLDLMAHDAPQGAGDARQWLEDVQNMKTTAAHLRRTIGGILEMTRVSDGRIKLAPRPIDARALLKQTAAAYEAHARARGVALSVEPGGAKVLALADADRLRQVVDNLVSNALKFSPAGATVRLSARCDRGEALLEVRDEGAGVPEDKRHLLFGKFQRLGAALDETEGTGLGLYISRRLMEAQGGRIDYAPGPGGRGSVFRASLPCTERA